jgi:hypothetical protein
VKATRTNTPLHALTTLNDVTFVEAARVLAERVMKEAPVGDDARLDRAFRLVLARAPSEAERPILLASVRRLRGQFAAEPSSAKRLVATGEAKRDESLDPVEHAAWTSACLALLNFDESLTKE